MTRCIVLLQGPRRGVFLVSEVPLYQGGGLAVGARREARVEDHAAVSVQPECPQVMRPMVLGAHLQSG